VVLWKNFVDWRGFRGFVLHISIRQRRQQVVLFHPEVIQSLGFFANFSSSSFDGRSAHFCVARIFLGGGSNPFPYSVDVKILGSLSFELRL